MRLNDTKIFQDKDKLLEMLNLRIDGCSISFLAAYYHCDKSSIRFQCDKYNVEPSDEKVYAVDRILVQTFPKVVGYWKEVNGERVNVGKSYKEYLQEANAKYPPKYR